MDQWSHKHKELGSDSLYGAMLKRIRDAGGNLRGLLWYQGEADANSLDSVTYEKRFTDWIADLRAEVGQPELPVVLVQLGRYVTPPFPEHALEWDRIREVLATLPHRVPYTAVTSAVDLGLVDAIHINTQGLFRLGNRLARLANEPGTHTTEIVGTEVIDIEEAPAQSGLGVVILHCRNVSGGWTPRHHMSGFELFDSKGSPHGMLQIVDASADSHDPKAIRILLTGPIDGELCIGYGLGYNPYCNIVDEADMPLFSFLPRPVKLFSN